MPQDIQKPQLDFVGIGFTKAGSTWIYKLLEEHPEIQVSGTKETNFFINNDLEQEPEKLKHYDEFFPRCKDSQIRGEFSPMYVARDQALRNIKKFYPDIKLIVVLRNPVERQISGIIYNYRLKEDLEKVDFDQVIQERFQGKEDQDIYHKHLKKWFDEFPRRNIHVIVLEEAARDSNREIKKLYEFLGVDASFRPKAVQEKANAAHAFRHPKLQKFFRNAHKRVKKHPRWNRILKKISRPFRLKQRIMQWNKKEFRKPEIHKQTKDLLAHLHQEEVRKLEQLLDKDLSIWKIKNKD